MSKKRFIASIFSPIKCLKYYSSFYFHRLFNGKMMLDIVWYLYLNGIIK